MTLPGRVSDLMPFDLLLSVARLGSLGRAAEAHGISQPAASARLRRLERQLGLVLIERSPRGSRLTPQGVLVAGWAQAAVDAAAALDAGVTALGVRRDAVLRVAASMTVAEYLLPGWLSALRAHYPGTTVTLTAGNSAEVADAILAGTADLGFVEGPDLPSGLRARRAGADVLTVVVAASHPWARRRSGITAAELAATPLVSREPASGTRRSLEHALRLQAAAEPVPPVAELSSTTAIKSAVMAGIGPAVLSSLAVAAEVAAGTLRAVPVRGLDLARKLQAVSAEGRPLTGPAGDLHTIAVRSAQAPAGGGLGEQHGDDGAPDPDLVALPQPLVVVDAPPVEPGAVGRVEVLDVPVGMGELEERMVGGGTIVADGQRALAADGEVLVEGVGLISGLDDDRRSVDSFCEGGLARVGNGGHRHYPGLLLLCGGVLPAREGFRLGAAMSFVGDSC
jgi:DNA-binding transcriptional LysR family regulator